MSSIAHVVAMPIMNKWDLISAFSILRTDSHFFQNGWKLILSKRQSFKVTAKRTTIWRTLMQVIWHQQNWKYTSIILPWNWYSCPPTKLVCFWRGHTYFNWVLIKCNIFKNYCMVNTICTTNWQFSYPKNSWKVQEQAALKSVTSK